MNKKSLSERDICTKFITPNLVAAGWDVNTQIREEVSFTDGRIYVRGKLHTRGAQKRADYILYYKPNIPIAVVEAKDNNHSVGAGIQQALSYADSLQVPFIFSSNGDSFLFHDKTAVSGPIEREIAIDEFPSPDDLWKKYKLFKGITEEIDDIVGQDYFSDGSKRTPRYYQQIAINRTVEAVARNEGNNRHLLVMATGTGKTYTAFQFIYRLWKSGLKKRILFLADRTALIDQTVRGDFRHFKEAMTIIKHKEMNPAYNIYLALYQGLSDNGDSANDAYKQFSPDFFDLIVVDECHRGSAREDSKWRAILEYFGNATHIGLTATPKETKDVSNTEYFGEPLYTYSLKQGIDDGFLAPYKVIKITLDIDADGWRPQAGFKDKDGLVVEDRIYGRPDFDKKIVIEERRQAVAKKVTEFLKGSNRFTKTIVFCVDIEHAEGMRKELANANADLVAVNSKYVMQITGDNKEGKDQLDAFINPSEPYPVIAVTSKLMTTGVDAQTCKLIVLDSNIGSMTEFKQIIGRGTRINEDFGKHYFTIMDFRNVTALFADKEFDGDPVRVKNSLEQEDISDTDSEIDDTLIKDSITGEVINFPETDDPNVAIDVGSDQSERRRKVLVNGVEVTVIKERVQYMANDGKISKHTGNAQNPKNIFHSEDEEAGSKKTALQKQHVVESNANIQRVDSGDSAANVQRFETDEVLENVQNVGIGMAAPNLQEFTNSAGASLTQQAVINESLSDNIQKLGQDHVAANMQQVPMGKGVTSRVQVIPGEGIAANQQMINQANTSANKQSVHEAGPAGVNRQPTDKENLKDHFEVLPSSTIESAHVNLGNSASQVSMGAEQPSSTGKGKQDDKPAHVTVALASQQVTKTKRDAFLGRLAGIKRDVGSISLKLDAMDDST